MKTETRNVICFEKKLIIALSSVHLTNFVKTEFASSSVHSNMEFQRRRTTKNLLRMVVHNYRRVWTREEKKANYEHGLMYCVVHGFDKFKKMGKNYLFNGFFIFNLTIFYFQKIFVYLFFNFFLELESWSITEMLFDEEERYLSRPTNPNPLSERDRTKRRKLLRRLGDQLARYLMDIKTENTKIQNSYNRANPIVLN